MVKTIPDGVRLTSMKQAGEVLTLEGVAESNARVASYMRNIDASPWMGRTDLRKIENKSDAKDADKKMPYVFSLDVKLKKPEDSQDAEKKTDKGVAESGAAPVAPASRGAPGAPANAAGATAAPAAATTGATAPAAAPPATPAPPAAAKDAEKKGDKP
jgi:type IV pilus assembly protein PilN